MPVSLFDLFKIGIGPSSSHTTGPMRAAREFALRLTDAGMLNSVTRVEISVYGSLALTGRGHRTDRALMLGLAGHRPEDLDAYQVNSFLQRVEQNGALHLLGQRRVPFSRVLHIAFVSRETLPGHSNGMRFRAHDSTANLLLEAVYYSIGGGFIVREGATVHQDDSPPAPHAYTSADDLLARCKQSGKSIWQLALENESARHGESQVGERVRLLWNEMLLCMERGLLAMGDLPGGLNIRRRAARLAQSLKTRPAHDSLEAMDWVGVFAMAVAEENAAGGRVVTAPTNGAAGVMPAVMRYYREFVPGADDEGIFRFMLTAAAIASLYKENASISGAEVGCQGEVGVACSIAAAGLVAAQGGTDEQVEKAAEIGMEHHLGMTCDPIAGLVQVPCIERNAMGATKAIVSARLAMREDNGHAVSLDQVIKTMFETGKDMQARYKETSLGGLAVHVERTLTRRS
jgi:L-serine dehydratase